MRGLVDEPGTSWHGRYYRANDPALLEWVSVTASLMGRAAFEAFARPLDAAEVARDWDEMQRGAVVSGVAPESLAPSRAAVYERFHATVENSPDLWVGPKARTVARVLFATPLSRGLFDPITTTALLPPRLRALYDLPGGASAQRAYDRRRGAVEALRRAAPPAYVPAWHQAQQRAASSQRPRQGSVQGAHGSARGSVYCSSWAIWSLERIDADDGAPLVLLSAAFSPSDMRSGLASDAWQHVHLASALAPWQLVRATDRGWLHRNTDLGLRRRGIQLSPRRRRRLPRRDG